MKYTFHGFFFQFEIFLLFKSRIKTSSQYFQNLSKIGAMVNMLIFKIWWFVKKYWLSTLSRTYEKKERRITEKTWLLARVSVLAQIIRDIICCFSVNWLPPFWNKNKDWSGFRINKHPKHVQAQSWVHTYIKSTWYNNATDLENWTFNKILLFTKSAFSAREWTGWPLVRMTISFTIVYLIRI